MGRIRGGWFQGMVALLLLGAWVAANARWAQRPGGENLAALWAAARMVLFIPDGDPYGPVAAAYARLLARASQPIPLLAPLYALSAVLPWMWLPSFTTMRLLALLAAQAALVLSLAVWPALTRWRPRAGIRVLFVLSPLLWPFVRWSLARGDGAAFALLIWVLVFAFLRYQQDDFAGFALALLWFDPLPHALAALWVLIWAGSHGRWRVVRAFGITLAGLLALAWWLRPQWWIGYLINVGRQVVSGVWPRFPVWLAERVPGLGPRFGWTAALAGGLLLLVEMLRSWARDYPHLAWVTALSLSLAPLIGVPMDAITTATLGLFVWWLVWSLWDKHWAYGRVAVAPLAALWFGGITWWTWAQGPQSAISLAYLNALVQTVALYTVRDWALRAESWTSWWA
ncbi:MAG: hypothetical protein GXO36_01815 [Chloroflexi bacterium]|nr:hypothetical protein [Chloroflexota bacterium]